ncbi:MAG: ABC transporter permease [Lentisphaerae bacterium]|nr:ABC transporter permease [Lentisphaerota bacterium]
MRADLFLAWKYFKPKRNAVSVITLISIVGVALGVAVLVVVLAVMTGFSDKMKEKLIDTTSHAQITPSFGTSIENPKQAIEAVEKLGGSAMPTIMGPILLQRGNNFLPKQMIAIDPNDKAVSKFNVKESIKAGKFSLEMNEIIISYVIAKELGVDIGDKILVHSPVKLSKMVKTNEAGEYEAAQGAYLPEEFTVTGIYSFDKYDFDKNVLFIGLDDARLLYDMMQIEELSDDTESIADAASKVSNPGEGPATHILVWTKDPYDMNDFKAKLSAQLPTLNVATWQEMNGRLLGVLAVEKNMQLFLLVFIVLVAAFSITNTLITTVIQKTREIGLLKAVGASSSTVMRIFLFQGFFVGTIGTTFGLILGWLFVKFRMNVLEFLRVVTGQEIFPKEVYVFNELPAHIVPMDLVTISAIAIILCTLGGLIPALRAARLDPAGALRSE